MIEGEENCPAIGEPREERSEEERRQRWIDGWTDKAETTAARQRPRVPSKKGCEGEQVWFRATEKHPNKRGHQKNGGGGLWLSGLALGWS